MNMLDMHTREKVNRLHIAEMHRAARIRQQLRSLNFPKNTGVTRGRTRLVLIGVILILLAATFLIAGTVS